jgi:hypothetical protein
MTETKWLSLNAGLMLLHLEQHGLASPRKLRLLAVVYARHLETLPEYADAKHVSHLGEDVAEGRATLAELLDERVRGWGYVGDWSIANLVLAADERLGNKIRTRMSMPRHNESGSDLEESIRRACEIIRPHLLCICGNPFRPVTADPSWLTSTVVLLAQGIYDDRAFDRLPILTDALQDAGCDDVDVLNHCRDAGPHARGCWVVDMLLGKT